MKHIDDVIFATLTSKVPSYPEQDWVDWISEHNTNQQRVEYFKKVSHRNYPFERVDLYLKNRVGPYTQKEILALKGLDRFPGFLEYVNSLPVNCWKLSFISQVVGLDCHWHHDFDVGGLGIRICLVGKDDNSLELLPTNKVMDENYDSIGAPWVEKSWGGIGVRALPLVDAEPKIIVPKGVKTGVSWLITSRLAFHRVRANRGRRVQAILTGRIDKTRISKLIYAENLILRSY